MPVTLRMAFRNLFEHKSKSLIIGILLAVGACVLVVGNGFIDASRQGIRTTFTDNYTGDVFVSGVSPDGDVSLFGVTSVGGMAATPTIPDFEKVFGDIVAMPAVDKAAGMATGYGIVTKGEEMIAENSGDGQDDPNGKTMASRFLFMFGVDPSNYWDVFNSIEFTSGAPLAPGQEGLILNEVQLAHLSEWLKKPLAVGDKLTVQGFSSAGMKLRELTILGTYRQKGKGSAPEQLAFVDIDTLRVMGGMTVGTNEAIELKASDTAMLAADNTDALFGDDLLDAAPAAAGGKFSESALKSQLADTTAREKANTADSGAWQFIVVRTKGGAGADKLIADLNAAFKAQGIAASAGNWQKAAGPYGQSVDVVRIVFTVAIAILSIVAIIIIMNTFVISVIERTGEIGTMRAIGAERGFIRRMFATEATVLAAVFSTLGATLGLGIVWLLRALKIKAGNPFLEILFGGETLTPIVTPISFVAAILAMVAIGYIAHLYPVSVALKIQPVRAMQQD